MYERAPSFYPCFYYYQVRVYLYVIFMDWPSDLAGLTLAFKAHVPPSVWPTESAHDGNSNRVSAACEPGESRLFSG